MLCLWNLNSWIQAYFFIFFLFYKWFVVANIFVTPHVIFFLYYYFLLGGQGRTYLTKGINQEHWKTNTKPKIVGSVICAFWYIWLLCSWLICCAFVNEKEKDCFAAYSVYIIAMVKEKRVVVVVVCGWWFLQRVQRAYQLCWEHLLSLLYFCLVFSLSFFFLGTVFLFWTTSHLLN